MEQALEVATMLKERAPVIEASHSRSLQFGLERNYQAEFLKPRPGVWRDVLERNELLRRNATPIMETLHEEIANTRSMVVLTDDDGLILHTQGDSDFLARAEQVALSPGVEWSEQAKGTNAIGTAIFEKRPTLIHADEHFLKSNHFLTCSATPIFGPSGHLAGVLDVTGDQRSFHQHTMALVRLSATMIENKLVLGASRSGFRVRFHKRAESIHSLAEGIVIFDSDGLICAVNRVACSQFGIERHPGQLRSFEHVFSTSLGRVLGQCQSQVPMMLYLNGDVPVYAIVEALSHEAHVTPRLRPTTTVPETPVVRPVNPAALDALDTGDPQMRDLLMKLKRLAGKNLPVLILGETGTGKELLARAIHQNSVRAERPFVAVNCAAIPENLIESELFGYAEGAFTGAKRRGYTGRIQQAQGGTLFLDEIGDMPLALQARLLRVLQERSVNPLGSSRAEPVDIALISATHRDLSGLIEAQTFRRDLYYRLNTLTLRLPALRSRTDLEALVALILTRLGEPERSVSARLMSCFKRHPWPGNIRELSNLLETMVALSDESAPFDLKDLPDPDYFDAFEAALAERGSEALLRRETMFPASASPKALTEIAVAAIEAALLEHHGNVSAAAKALGISRNTIYRRTRPLA